MTDSTNLEGMDAKTGLVPGNFPKSYWLDVPLLMGNLEKPPETASIVVIGSGLSGASCGYWLQRAGFEDLLIVDYEAEQSASYRNAGHILYGPVESMKALCEIHGEEKAREIWQFSIDICNQVETTMKELDIAADYRRDGYMVIAIDETEDGECKESVKLLNRMGFQSDYLGADEVQKLGFKNCRGARFEKGSAQAHPVKFRNGVMRRYLDQGGRYHSGVRVIDVVEDSDGVVVRTSQGEIRADAAVIAANAYSPLFAGFFKSRGLIDPFRGQVVTSKPLKHKFKVKYPHSFDHGYQYALVTQDNRLLIGGWRQHTSTREMGTYSIDVNPHIEKGLQDFVRDYYELDEKVEWQYSWSGIMAASKTGMPFIGNTSSPRIYSCAGYTGHGFSWAHGSAKLLADIVAGNPLPSVARLFNPKSTD